MSRPAEINIDVAKAYDQRRDGMKWSDIAKAHKVSIGSIVRYVKKYEQDQKLERVTYNPDEAEIDTGKIGALYRAGWILKEIALECNCSEDKVKEVICQTI